MSIDWNGLLVSVVDQGATSYETRLHRQILFAGAVGLVLLIVWRLFK